MVRYYIIIHPICTVVVCVCVLDPHTSFRMLTGESGADSSVQRLGQPAGPVGNNRSPSPAPATTEPEGSSVNKPSSSEAVDGSCGNEGSTEGTAAEGEGEEPNCPVQ